MILAIFWQLDHDEIGIKDRAGAMFLICINQMMSAYYNALVTFEMEWDVFLWEYNDKSYGIIPYFFIKTFIEIPFMFIFPIVFSAIVYFAIGFEADFEKFVFFSFALCVLVTCAASYGMMIETMFKSAATAIGSLIMMPLILFGGFFANAGDYPGYITWI